jgi:hypothetical protein
MNSTLLRTSAAIGLLAAAPASAAPTISYVPNSLVQSVINHGPWTLHESTNHFAHDASGIVPPAGTPPYSGTGFPYAGYCGANGKPSTNHGVSLMQPYYFPFVRKHGGILEGFFDYRPRNQ